MMPVLKAVAGAQIVLTAALAAQAAVAAGAVVSAPDKSVLFWSVHKPDERVAINIAMAQCGERFGGGCFLLKSFSFGCIAVARRSNHRHWGYAWRRSPDAAQLAAADACDATGSRSCAIQTTSCE